MVFADSKDIQTHLIGVCNLIDQIAQTIRRVDRATGVVVCRCEAVNSNLHPSPSHLISPRYPAVVVCSVGAGRR